MEHHSHEHTPAQDRVFSTDELFDSILSHLTPSDHFAVARVSRSLRRAVLESHSWRKMLFLSPRPALPGRWFLLCRRPAHLRGMDVYTIEPQSSIDDFADFANHAKEENGHLVELCPWLTGDSAVSNLLYKTFEATLGADHFLEDMRQAGPVSHAIFPFEPEEGSVFANMLLTSPPCHDAYICIRYSHDKDQVALSTEHFVHASFTLTLCSLLRAARSTRGCVIQQHTTGQKHHRHRIENTSIDAEIAKYQSHGGRFKMDVKKTMVFFFRPPPTRS